MRWSWIGAFTVTLTLVIATSTAAAPPSQEDFTFDDQFVDDGLCGFPLNFSFVGGGTATTFFDEEGNPTRVQIHVSQDATITNPTNQKTLSGHETVNVREDVEEGTVTFTGLGIHQNVPGHGAVLLEAGRLVFDFESGTVTFMAGPHPDPAEGDFEDFCAALA